MKNVWQINAITETLKSTNQKDTCNIYFKHACTYTMYIYIEVHTYLDFKVTLNEFEINIQKINYYVINILEWNI